MPDINLLDSSIQQSRSRSVLATLLYRLLFGLLCLVFIGYGLLWYQERRLSNDITEAAATISKHQDELLNNKDRNELLTRQEQVQKLEALTREHLYWSLLLSELPQMTLKTASLISFTANAEGVATMVVSVPSFEELDKFMQVFDKPTLNKNFRDVRIKSISKTQQGPTLQIKAKLQLIHNLDLLKKTL